MDQRNFEKIDPKILDWLKTDVESGNLESIERHLSALSEPSIYLNCFIVNEPQLKCTIPMLVCQKENVQILSFFLHNFQFDLDIRNTVQVLDRDQNLETFYDVSLLWVGAALNNFQIVKLLVRYGANVNFRSRTNSTPLRCACCNNALEMVRYLVDHGADINIAKERNFTNLIATVFNGHIEMVIYLVEILKCDVNESIEDGRSPLNAAVHQGDTSLVEYLIQKGAKNFPSKYDQMSPLLIAAEKRREDLVLIISKIASIDEQIEAREMLAASFACADLGDTNFRQSFGHFQEAMRLRLALNKPKQISQTSNELFFNRKECQTLDELETIRFNSEFIIIEALLVRQRILTDKNSKFLHSLFYQGANFADQQQFSSALKYWIYAMERSRENGIKIDKIHFRQCSHLISQMVLDLSSVPINSLKTIFDAINMQLLKEEVHHDYNLHSLLFLTTVLSKIFYRSTTSEADRLCIRQLFYSIVHMKHRSEKDGSTLLHLCLNSTISSKVPRFDSFNKYPSIELTRLLLECGADVNALDKEKNTPLHIFLWKTNNLEIDFLKILFEYGAHPDYANAHGKTPINMTNNEKHTTLVKQKMMSSLKCICARRIMDSQIQIDNMFGRSLAGFVHKH